MATDVRGHTVPAASGHPARSDLLSLALSIRDPIPVASVAARATKLSSLASAGITPSTSNPIAFWRADAGDGRELEYTTDGTTFWTVDAVTGETTVTASSGWAWTGGDVRIRGGDGEFAPARITRQSTSIALSTGAANAVQIGTVPAGYRPSALDVYTPAIIRLGDASTVVQACEIRFVTSGVVQVQVGVAGTLTTSGYIAIPAQRWVKA
jgi:hypothetical protein